VLEGRKVVSATEMARVEGLNSEGPSSAERYMWLAGAGVVKEVERKKGEEKKVTLLIGRGNNGGDGLVAGSLLRRQGYHVVGYVICPMEEMSILAQKQRKRFVEEGGVVREIQGMDPRQLSLEGVIVDGLFGTGFRGPLQGFILELIRYVNRSACFVVSIDIPSGLNGDTGRVDPIAIRADKTVCLGLPKFGLFLEEGCQYVGELCYVDFGLSVCDLDEMRGCAYLVDEVGLARSLPVPSLTQHKYQAGYVIAVAGSQGMGGAAMLSTLAAFRSGAGIVRLFYPQGMEGELVAAPYELIKSSYTYQKVEPILKESGRAGACLIGPGVGRSDETKRFLFRLLSELSLPLVIDADALYALEGRYSSLKVSAIMTPHHQEMRKLLDKDSSTHLDLIEGCQSFADECEVVIVLKGMPTYLFSPRSLPILIRRGDPGMATAGAGDVLTGVIAALLAKGLSLKEAAALGVYLHALSGEFAARKKGSHFVMASELICHLSQAFRVVEKSQLCNGGTEL